MEDDDEVKGSINLVPTSRKRKAEQQEHEHAPLLKSRKALKAFHEKCIDFANHKNMTYLDPDDFTELLGGKDHVTPKFVSELMNVLVSNVYPLSLSPCICLFELTL